MTELTSPEYDSAGEFIRIARENRHGITNVIVPNTGAERRFIEFCKLKQPSDIINLLAGFTTDLPATCLAAETVNKILKYHSADNYNAYKYAHALCPMVHDRWNLNKDKCIGGATGGVVDCYWRNLGDLTYKPQLHEFAKLVLSALNGGLSYGLVQAKMANGLDSGIPCCVTDCDYPNIHFNGGNANGYWCTNCRSAFHVHCFNKVNEENLEDKIGFDGKKIYRCAICHIIWDLKNRDSNNKGYQKW